MRILLLTLGLIFTLSPYPQKAADQHPLVGTWKLISPQSVSDNGELKDDLGPHRKGYLILTLEGRMMVLATDDARRADFSDAGLAELHKSMFAYTGKYRIEGDDLVTTVDVSWNELWNGTEQRRHYKLEGNKLTLVTGPLLNPISGKTSTGSTLVWERE